MKKLIDHTFNMDHTYNIVLGQRYTYGFSFIVTNGQTRFGKNRENEQRVLVRVSHLELVLTSISTSF